MRSGEGLCSMLTVDNPVLLKFDRRIEYVLSPPHKPLGIWR